MMCSGARKHRCWNGISFDGPMAAKKIAAAAYEAVEVLEGFDPAFLAIVREEADRLDGDRMHRIENLRVQLTAAERIVDNFANYVKGGDDSPTIREKLRSAEHEAARLTARGPTPKGSQLIALKFQTWQRRSRSPTNVFAILWSTPRSSRRSCGASLRGFPSSRCDFVMEVRSYFALVFFQLTELLEDSRGRDVLRRPLRAQVIVDLFNLPQRAAFRERVVTPCAAGKKEHDIAAELGITKTAVQAMALQRLMNKLGVMDAYQAVLELPPEIKKLKRQKHLDYRFEPLPPSDPASRLSYLTTASVNQLVPPRTEVRGVFLRLHYSFEHVGTNSPKENH